MSEVPPPHGLLAQVDYIREQVRILEQMSTLPVNPAKLESAAAVIMTCHYRLHKIARKWREDIENNIWAI